MLGANHLSIKLSTRQQIFELSNFHQYEGHSLSFRTGAVTLIFFTYVSDIYDHVNITCFKLSCKISLKYLNSYSLYWILLTMRWYCTEQFRASFWRYIELNHKRWQLCSSKWQIIYSTKNCLSASYVDENYLLLVLNKNILLLSSNLDIFFTNMTVYAKTYHPVIQKNCCLNVKILFFSKKTFYKHTTCLETLK